jgi:hypothetical protein
MEYSRFNIKRIKASTGYSQDINGYASSAVSSSATWVFKDMILDGNNLIDYGFATPGNDGYYTSCKYINCKAMRHKLRGYSLGSGGSNGPNKYIENCISYDNAREGFYYPDTSGGRYNFKNCATLNCGKTVGYNDWSGGTNYTTYNNNADSDNSLPAHTGKVTGITSADFLSVDPASADFLKINTASKLYGVGSTDILSENTSDIEGNPRPNALGLVSIGCYEPVVEPPVVLEPLQQYLDIINNHPRNLLMQFGNLSLRANVAQMTDLDILDGDGVLHEKKIIVFNRDTNGNDEIELLQGSK